MQITDDGALGAFWNIRDAHDDSLEVVFCRYILQFLCQGQQIVRRRYVSAYGQTWVAYKGSKLFSRIRVPHTETEFGPAHDEPNGQRHTGD